MKNKLYKNLTNKENRNEETENRNGKTENRNGKTRAGKGAWNNEKNR